MKTFMVVPLHVLYLNCKVNFVCDCMIEFGSKCEQLFRTMKPENPEELFKYSYCNFVTFSVLFHKMDLSLGKALKRPWTPFRTIQLMDCEIFLFVKKIIKNMKMPHMRILFLIKLSGFRGKSKVTVRIYLQRPEFFHFFA